jgi:hypothetical protein
MGYNLTGWAISLFHAIDGIGDSSKGFVANRKNGPKHQWFRVGSFGAPSIQR